MSGFTSYGDSWSYIHCPMLQKHFSKKDNTMKLDKYTVEKLRDGHVKIGCQIVTWEYIEEVMEHLKLQSVLYSHNAIQSYGYNHDEAMLVMTALEKRGFSPDRESTVGFSATNRIYIDNGYETAKCVNHGIFKSNTWDLSRAVMMEVLKTEVMKGVRPFRSNSNNSMYVRLAGSGETVRCSYSKLQKLHKALEDWRSDGLHIGDKVSVHDGSCCMGISDGRLQHLYPALKRDDIERINLFTIVATDPTYALPTQNSNKPNDTIIQNVYNGQIIFTQSRFLTKVAK